MNLVLAFATLFCLALSTNQFVHGRPAREVVLEWPVVFLSLFYGLVFVLGAIGILANTGLISMSSLLMGAIVLLLAGLWRRMHSGVKPIQHNTLGISDFFAELDRPSRILLIGALLTLGLAALFRIIGFPEGYEARAYHIPVGLEVFRTHSLQVYAASGLPTEASFTFTYPSNISIWHGFLLQALPERLTGIAQLPFLGLLLITVYALARRIGADRNSATLAALALLSVPMVFFGTLESGSDVAGLALAAASAYFLLREDHPDTRSIILAGLAIGLAYGFKALHLNTILVLGLYTIYASWSTAPPGLSTSTTARNTTVFAAFTFALGGFWLLRNGIVLHNPLYPVHLGNLFDALGFARTWDFDYSAVSNSELEWVRKTANWPIYPWLEWHFLNQNFKATAGTGPYFAGIAIPLFLLTLATSIRPGSRAPKPVIALAWLCVLLLILWSVQGVRQPRYALLALVLMLPISAWWMSLPQTSRPLRALGGFAVAIMLLVAISRSGIQFGDRILLSGQTQRHLFYEYPQAVDELPEDSVILNLGSRIWNYPLYGHDLSNRVVPYMEATGKVVTTTEAGNDNQGPLLILDAQELARRHVTHIFDSRDLRLKVVGACYTMTLVERMDSNPLNGHALPNARTLRAIVPCAETGTDKR